MKKWLVAFLVLIVLLSVVVPVYAGRSCGNILEGGGGGASPMIVIGSLVRINVTNGVSGQVMNWKAIQRIISPFLAGRCYVIYRMPFWEKGQWYMELRKVGK